MNLTEKINQDLKESMKSGDKLRLQTVRSIRALILEYEKSGKDVKFSPEDEIKLLSSAAKKRKDAIEQYEKAKRIDLADIEKKELDIILSYLPEQLSNEDILDEVKKLAAELNVAGKNDFGKLMSAAAKTLKGQADGKLIKEIVMNFLGSN